MKNWLVCLFVFFAQMTYAQAQSSTKYADECWRMVIQGDSIAKAKGEDSYKQALAKYNAAKACGQSLTKTVNDKILALFNAIENEKNEAVRQRERAKKQTRIAEERRREAERARTAEVEGRIKAEKEAKANSLVTLALKNVPIDPTLAFSYTQRALELTPVNLAAAEVRNSILQENIFYGRMLLGHQGWIRNLKLSPNGDFLFSGATDGRFIVWDTKNWESNSIENRSSAKVCAIDVSKEKQQVLCAYEDGFVCISPIDKPNAFVRRGLIAKDIKSAAFVPSKKAILLGGADGWVRFWDWEKQAYYDSLKIGNQEIIQILSTPHNGLMAFATKAEVQIWDLQKRVLKKTLKTPDFFIQCIAVSLDEAAIYIGNGPFMSKFSLEGELLFNMGRHPSAVSSIDVAENGSIIVVGTNDGRTYLWDKQGNYLNVLSTIPKEGSPAVGAFSVSASSEGKIIYTGSGDQAIRTWHLDNKQVFNFQADMFEASGIGYEPNKNRLVTTGMDGNVSLRNISGKVISQISVFSEGIYSSDTDSLFQLFFVGGVDSAAIIALKSDSLVLLRKWKAHQSGPVTRVRWIHKRKELITASKDGWVNIWDEYGEKTETYPLKGLINDLASDTKGKYIAVAAEDSTAYLIHRNSGKIESLKHPLRVVGLDFAPNDSKMITASGNVLRIWDTSSSRVALNTVSLPRSSIWTVRFSNDGERFAVGCWDGSTRIFDKFGQEVQTFRTNKGVVRYIRFSSDDNFLLSGDNQGGVSINRTIKNLLEQNMIYRFIEK